MFSGRRDQIAKRSKVVSIPDRVLGVFRRDGTEVSAKAVPVSIPDRVLGVFRQNRI